LCCRKNALITARVKRDKGFEIARHGGHVNGVERTEFFPARAKVDDQSGGPAGDNISLQFQRIKFLPPAKSSSTQSRSFSAFSGWLVQKAFASSGQFEQQRLAAIGRFHFAVGDLGDFKFSGNRQGNAFKLTAPVKLADKIAERFKSHTREIN
jgi:hypothetical protein